MPKKKESFPWAVNIDLREVAKEYGRAGGLFAASIRDAYHSMYLRKLKPGSDDYHTSLAGRKILKREILKVWKEHSGGLYCIFLLDLDLVAALFVKYRKSTDSGKEYFDDIGWPIDNLPTDRNKPNEEIDDSSNQPKSWDWGDE